MHERGQREPRHPELWNNPVVAIFLASGIGHLTATDAMAGCLTGAALALFALFALVPDLGLTVTGPLFNV